MTFEHEYGDKYETDLSGRIDSRSCMSENDISNRDMLQISNWMPIAKTKDGI